MELQKNSIDIYSFGEKTLFCCDGFLFGYANDKEYSDMKILPIIVNNNNLNHNPNLVKLYLNFVSFVNKNCTDINHTLIDIIIKDNLASITDLPIEDAKEIIEEIFQKKETEIKIIADNYTETQDVLIDLFDENEQLDDKLELFCEYNKNTRVYEFIFWQNEHNDIRVTLDVFENINISCNYTSDYESYIHYMKNTLEEIIKLMNK